MRITITQLDKWEACDREPGERYSDERLAKLFAGRRSLTLAEVLSLRIPPEDKVWIATQEGVLTPEQLKEFGNRTADRAVRRHCLHCGTPAVEAWSRDWLSGSDRSEASAVEASWASWAASAAARSAARSASAAARSAARSAVEASWAASAAAWAAAEAAGQASRHRERLRQVADLREILGGER